MFSLFYISGLFYPFCQQFVTLNNTDSKITVAWLTRKDLEESGRGIVDELFRRLPTTVLLNLSGTTNVL